MSYTYALFQGLFFDRKLSKLYEHHTICNCLGCVILKINQNILNNTNIIDLSIFHKWMFASKLVQNAKNQTLFDLFAHCMTELVNKDKICSSTKPYAANMIQNISNKITHTISCMQCGYVYDIHTTNFVIQIELAETISHSLNGFFNESMIGDRDFKCLQCRRPYACIKRIKISYSPQILCFLILKNHNFYVTTYGLTRIPYRLDINMHRTLDNIIDSQYTLSSIIYHNESGSTNENYKTLRIRSKKTGFLLEDESVTMVKLQKLDHKNAYMIIYKNVSFPN